MKNILSEANAIAPPEIVVNIPIFDTEELNTHLMYLCGVYNQKENRKEISCRVHTDYH